MKKSDDMTNEEFLKHMDKKYGNDRFGGIDDMDYATDTTPDVVPKVKNEDNEDQTGE